jgi:hypothetical protein
VKLRPLDLETAKRNAILERAGEVQRQCQVRPMLAPQAGDPPTLNGRIERLEREVKDMSPGAPLDRLYLDAMENVLSRSRKVIIDAQAENGNVLYLPLDKLMERSSASDSEPIVEHTIRASPEPDEANLDDRARGER